MVNNLANEENIDFSEKLLTLHQEKIISQCLIKQYLIPTLSIHKNKEFIHRLHIKHHYQ